MGGNSSKYNNNKLYDESISLPPKLRKMKERDEEMKKKNNNLSTKSIKSINGINSRGTEEIFQGGEDADLLNKMAFQMEKRKKQQQKEMV